MYYYRNPDYRQYGYRTSGFFLRMPPAVKFLIIANVVIFFIQIIAGLFIPRGLMQTSCGLMPLAFETIFGIVPCLFLNALWIWQPVTYMFLHGGLAHIFFNMLILWMFGSEMEKYWGTAKFIKYYFITGMGAALLTIAFTYSSVNITIGASGAIFGVLLAFGITFPERKIYIWFIIPVKAKHLIIFFAILEFVFAFSYTGDGIGHLAHFGGMLFGYLYLKRVWRIREFIADIKWKLRRRKFKVMDDDWKDYYH